MLPNNRRFLERCTPSETVWHRHSCLCRFLCAAPPGLANPLNAHPGLTPWATFLSRLQRSDHRAANLSVEVYILATTTGLKSNNDDWAEIAMTTQGQ